MKDSVLGKSRYPELRYWNWEGKGCIGVSLAKLLAKSMEEWTQAGVDSLLDA